MNSPQLEGGYTRLANEILEALCRYRIRGEEMQCLLTVIRKTYGYGKKVDAISLSQFAAMTGLKRPNVVRALNGLLSKKILAVIKKDTTSISNYSLNKDYSGWAAVIKKDTTPLAASINTDKALLSEKIHTKETLTKESKNPLLSEFFTLWNTTVEGNLPAARSLTTVRKRKIKTRLEERPLSEWQTVFEKMAASSFCCGENDRRWKADFDWILDNDNNAVKVLEGKFDNRQHQPTRPGFQL